MNTTDDSDSSSREPDSQKKRKREVSVGIQESAKIRRKPRKESKILDQEVNNADLISELPDHVIHHILSFLRCKKDAARSSILSKRWRAIWASYSILELDQRRFLKKPGKLPKHCKRNVLEIVKNRKREIGEKTEMFRNFVDDILGSRIEQNCSIKKYIFHLTSYDSKLSMDMDRWLGVVKESGIHELDLFVPSKKNRSYTVPQTIFSAKTITALKIFGCKMDECKDIQFFGLRKLCLGKLNIDDHTMQNLLLSCPLLEDLRLVYCRGFRSLFSSSSKLIRVDLHCCNGLNKIELRAPILQMFWFHGDKHLACDYQLEMCTSLKSLTLKVSKLRDDSFQNLLSSFPVLEHLSVSKCNGLERVTISSHRLKTLALTECKNLVDADIDTPNLLSLEYKGSSTIPFYTFNPSGLKEAKLSFSDCDTIILAGLRKFVGKFDKNMRMTVQSKKNAILHEDLTEILIPQARILKLEFVKWSMSFEDLVDRLLQSYPKRLTTTSSANSNFSKRVHSRITEREEKPSCCTYNASNNKCWRHYLKDVTIKKFEDFCDYHDLEESCWMFSLESLKSKMVNEVVSYGLDWRKGEKKLEEDEVCIENEFMSSE